MTLHGIFEVDCRAMHMTKSTCIDNQSVDWADKKGPLTNLAHALDTDYEGTQEKLHPLPIQVENECQRLPTLAASTA